MKKRIFIGPLEIAGFYFNLYEGFKKNGIKCDFVTFDHHEFNYRQSNYDSTTIRLIRYLNKKKRENNQIKKLLYLTLAEIISFFWGVKAIFKYDVFIFSFGRSLLRFNIDLYILKLLSKTVISHLGHGSEARPSYLNGSFHRGEYDSDKIFYKKLFDEAKISKKLVKRHEKLATYVIGYPLSTYYFSTKSFINSIILGIPYGYKIKLKKQYNKKEDSIRILHAPSSPHSKGTFIVENSILNLKNKGYKIDLIKIIDKPNSEVLNIINNCDFVVDQLFSDGPLPGLATEAAFFGKPSVIGGYGLNYLKKRITSEMWPPSKICEPDQLENTIENFILNKKERIELGLLAKKFVTEKWNQKSVAKKYIQIINGNIPDSWWLNPNEILYFEGYGQSKDQLRKTIKNLTDTYGIDALNLSHNKTLENAFINYYNLND